MKFTRVKTTVVAGLMAASMILPGVTAFAADSDIKAGALKINKTIKVGQGVTVPATDIKFEATQTSGNNADGTTQAKTGLGTTEFTISLPETTTTNGSGIAENVALTALESKMTVNGEYTFELTETAPADKTGEYGWTNDDTKYYLHAYKTDNGYTYIVTTTNEADTDEDGNVTSLKGKISSDDFAFVNEYTKEAGTTPTVDPDDPSAGETTHGALEITKTVTGTSKDYSDAFKFKVTLTNSTTSTIAAGDKLNYTVAGASKEAEVESADDVLYVEIELKNGQTASFSKIEAGVGVTVEETSRPNTDDTKVKAMFNGGSYSEEISATSATGVLGEKANIVKFTNEATDITVTGVVTSTAPYVTLVVVAVAAVAAYVVMKRRVAK